MLTSAVAKMRAMLFEMEQDLGIADLTEAQRDVLYAISLLAGNGSVASIEDIQNHGLTQSISRPTLFRALNTLADKKIIARIGSERSGKYQIL